jgi:hypothetical protein
VSGLPSECKRIVRKRKYFLTLAEEEGKILDYIDMKIGAREAGIILSDEREEGVHGK